jgi:phospholipid/cholesterol/gamma-HCH transport system substrate-binding protein
MKRFGIETAVGLFLIIGFLSFAYLSIELGEIPLFGSNDYLLTARFESVSGLKDGAIIEVAGVKIGKVARINLDDYRAVVHMLIHQGVQIPDDSIASIRTQGIIGDKYIKISPGGSDMNLKAGGQIRDTESALDLEELISKYIMGKV